MKTKNLDDIAYEIYEKFCIENKSIKYLSKNSFIFYQSHLLIFYNKAKIELRKKKLKKLNEKYNCIL